jgi:Flp pilus assembly protein TadG
MNIRRRFRGLKSLRSERGAALVEFALVVPFLVIMMCATIDFGLCVWTLNNLTAAAREGGRYGAVLDGPTWAANGGATAQAAVRDRVYKYIVGMNTGLTAAQVNALITVTNPDPTTKNITVKITNYPYRPVTPLASLIGFGTINLNRMAIFRHEFGS